jgi:hypothetical protein
MTDTIWAEEFVPWLIEQCENRRRRHDHKRDAWYLLTMDGYGSHTLTPEALAALWDAHIYCICFPSHTSSELQPLDKSVFGPMKHFFKQLLEARMRQALNIAVTKWELCEIMYKARLMSHNYRNITSGFRASGVYPFNVDWVKDNASKSHISTFFSTEEDSNKEKRAKEELMYVNIVADFGPRDTLDAYMKIKSCPHIDLPMEGAIAR